VALGLADQHVQGAALARVAPHVPLVHALVVRCVPVAVRSRVAQHLVVQPLVVLRRVAQVRSSALACCLRLRLLALQRSALAQHPSRERLWSLAR
jgi:hypothetical protein